MAFVFTVVLLLASRLLPALAADSCPSFGTEFPRGNDTSNSGLWLNFDTPSPCTGTAVEWRFCYFVKFSNVMNVDLEARLRVYRKNNNGVYNTQFEDEVIREYRSINDLGRYSAVCDNGDPPYCCENMTISEQVQKNDIIGVCMRDVGNRDPLFLLDKDAPEHTVYHYPSTDSCGGNSDSFTEMELDSLTSGFGLHAFLEVTVLPSSSLSVLPSSSLSVQPTVQPPPSSGGVGVAIGVVIAVIVIIGLITAVIVIVVFLMRRSRSYSTIQTTVKHQGRIDALTNLVYDATAGTTATPTNSTVKTDLPQHYSTADHSAADYEDTSTFEDAPEVLYSAVDDTLDYQCLIEQVRKEGDVTYGDPSPYCVPAWEEDELYQQIRQSGIERIAKESIEITGYLGSGEFGKVNKGTMRTSTDKILDVAVKTMTAEATQTDKVRFLQEGAIMAQFKHPNVVKMYGVVKSNDELMLIVELLPKGDLHHFLVGMRPDPGQILPSYVPKQFVNFCQQIALGMQYLSGRGFVHRDLAARNILVSASTICKIGDFGMSRDLADDTYYVSHGGKIPVRWTAPEAIHFKKYSTASDVWSYGCLLYEIWSVGCKPFHDVKNIEVVRKVDSGDRLPPPPGCPRGIYDIMLQCWHPDPSSRPPFRDLLIALLENEDSILEIPSDALSTHRQAGVLGAPLEAGEEMYKGLQQTYKNDAVLSDNACII